jgi:hypothetical protein
MISCRWAVEGHWWAIISKWDAVDLDVGQGGERSAQPKPGDAFCLRLRWKS